MQFELVEQPRLAPHLPQAKGDLLEAALNHSRYCLKLNAQDADALFNTGQVLASTAEHLLEENADAPRCVGLLKEAVDTFEKCFAVQQAAYLRQQEETAAISAEQNELQRSAPEPSPSPREQASSSPREEWAAVFEPTTVNTLLDTCLAQMQAFTALVPLVAVDRSTLAEMQSLGAKISQRSSQLLPEVPGSHNEILGAEAGLSVALSAAAFSLNLLSPEDFSSHVNAKFSYAGVDSSAATLCEAADARIAFSETTADAPSAQSQISHATLAALQWRQLSLALDNLAQAAKLPIESEPWKLHERRAEAELMRAMMGVAPAAYPQAEKNRELLLKNAEVYYRGARNLAQAEGEATIAEEMGQKEAVVQMLAGLRAEDASWKQVYEEMREDRLVP